MLLGRELAQRSRVWVRACPPLLKDGEWGLRVELVGVTTLDQGTLYRNAQLRYTHIMYCTLWEKCKQTQCSHRSWRERTTVLTWYYSPTKNKLERILMTFGFLVNIENTIEIYSYSTPWALFPQKWCVAPEFFVLISSHCSTQILRIRHGGSWSIYFLSSESGN